MSHCLGVTGTSDSHTKYDCITRLYSLSLTLTISICSLSQMHVHCCLFVLPFVWQMKPRLWQGNPVEWNHEAVGPSADSDVQGAYAVVSVECFGIVDGNPGVE